MIDEETGVGLPHTFSTFTRRLQKEPPIQFIHAQNYCAAILLHKKILQMVLSEQRTSFSGLCVVFLEWFSSVLFQILDKWVEVRGPALLWGCIGSRILKDILAGSHHHQSRSEVKIACVSTGLQASAAGCLVHLGGRI